MAPPGRRAGDATRSFRVAVIRLIDLVSGGLNLLGALAIVALMVLICADVAGRYFFNAPITGTTEIVGMSIAAIVFLQLGDTIARGRLTRAETLVSALEQRAPAMLRVINALAALAGIALMAILLYGVIPSMLNDYRRGFFIGTRGIFTFPSWPIKAFIAVGVAVAALQLTVLALRAALDLPDDRKTAGSGGGRA